MAWQVERREGVARLEVFLVEEDGANRLSEGSFQPGRSTLKSSIPAGRLRFLSDSMRRVGIYGRRDRWNSYRLHVHNMTSEVMCDCRGSWDISCEGFVRHESYVE